MSDRGEPIRFEMVKVGENEYMAVAPEGYDAEQIAECRKAFELWGIGVRLDETIPPGTIIATDGKTVVRIDGIE